MQNMDKKRRVLGWVALGLSITITCFWAFWGIIENFHEGWYSQSWLANVGLMLVQYLGPMLVFMALTLISISWPRLGGGLHAVLILLAAGFFDVFNNTVMLLILLPLAGLGALYWFGRPQPRRAARWLAIGLPLLTLMAAGIEPVLRVSQRLDDGILAARLVAGNGVFLIWAPAGPGWPHQGGDWYQAGQACQYLAEDGLSLAATRQNIWRLPNAEEAVRSMMRHGRNSGGTWDVVSEKASYQTTPDKESPLWQVHSQVIYWWTASEIDADRAYIIAYDGQVWPRSKDLGPDYLGYRCVKGQ